MGTLGNLCPSSCQCNPELGPHRQIKASLEGSHREFEFKIISKNSNLLSIFHEATEELGIKELVPAYLDPALKSTDLPTGVSFASGGSGYDPLTPQIVSVLSLTDQLRLFKEYIEKLKGVVGEERTNFILANSIFLVVSGSDDIANTYFLTHVRELHYDVPSYTNLMVNWASTFLQVLKL
ncbi:hypothetical protein L1049_026896 [Liquidambar formosana]|uniref:Uncharacterized protein n=1 Tax=Liquidambar formosana TaxID=63359 RepID=A0AAP0R939_LIQFO